MKNNLQKKIIKNLNLRKKSIIEQPLKVLKKINIERLTKITALAVTDTFKNFKIKIKQKEQDRIQLLRKEEIMANTKSAIKRIRQIVTQTLVNKARKSKYRNAIKKMNLLLEEKKKDEALKFLPKLNSELMKVAKTGIIKKANASRNVSRITKKISAL